MSTWLTFRAAVESALALAVADSTIAIAWEDEPRPMANQMLLLSVVSASPMHDREILAEGSHDISTLMHIVLQVKSESIFDDSSADGLFLAEKARAGFFRFTAKDALAAAETRITHFPTGVITPRPFESDGRIISAYIFEIEFNTVFDLVTGESPDFIEHVTVTGNELEEPDGTPIPFTTTIDQP